MSEQLINLSPDLKQLRDEGYDIEIVSGHLVVRDVPYVNSRGEIQRGSLVSSLVLAGDITGKPDTHVAHFIGEHPCGVDHTPIRQIQNASQTKSISKDLVIDHTFSAKPTAGYENYFDKMTTYIAILSGPAQQIDPRTTARTHPVITNKGSSSVFEYLDAASSRAEIDEQSKKFELIKVAIVGLGGTGSYILDLVAKTPVQEIHLFDGDVFYQHNAFRSPGAASVEMLREKMFKTDYFTHIYSKMHRGIHSHPEFMGPENFEKLKGIDIAFLSLDSGSAKRRIIEKLEELSIAFIDVGMGIDLTDGALGGILRVTTSTSSHRDHIRSKNRIPLFESDGQNEYDRNIQIADLNALNATLAVIKWKKLLGYYRDLDQEYHTTYTIDGNHLLNEDKPNA